MTTPITDRRQLADTLLAFSLSRVLSTTVTSGVADALAAAGRATSSRLAAELALPPAHLDRLLATLVAAGLAERYDDGQVGLTEVGALLADGGPGSLAPMARMLHTEGWSAWTGFPDWLARSAADDDVFDEFDADPERYEVFEQQMRTGSARHAAAVVAAAGLTGDESLCDVGGGSGAMARAFLTAHDGMRATVGDRGYARAGAEAYLADLDRDRWDFVDLDFFTEVPTGYDVYLLSRILHDWDDDRARVILRSCAAAMSDASRLLVFERSTSDAKTVALTMADLNTGLMCGGRERDLAEFTELLTAEGFRVVRTVPVTGEHWLIEARLATPGRR